jgi:hypothetical protein
MWRQTLQYHPVIGYRFIPGIKVRIPHSEGGGYLIRVNDAGFRCDHNFDNEKPSSIRRILLFGDSFTAGDGVSNGKRFGDLLETEIPKLEVYNFGLPGTGTDQQYLAYKEYARNIDHDVLIIAVFVENIRRVAAHYRIFLNENGEHLCYAKPYYELIEGKLHLKNVPPDKEPHTVQEIPLSERNAIDFGPPLKKMDTFFERWGVKNFGNVLRNLLNTWGIKGYIQKLIRNQPLPEYNYPANTAWLTMRAILEEWIHDHPKPVLLVLIPHSQYVEGIADPRQYQARFRELEKAVDCGVYDSLPDLQRFPLKIRRNFRYKEGHFNKEGNAVFANLLVPVISDLLNQDNRRRFHE